MKEVIVCDICKMRLAKHKCKICNNDLCDVCVRYFILKKELDKIIIQIALPDHIYNYFTRKETEKIKKRTVKICVDCKEKLTKINYDIEILIELAKEFFPILRKYVIIDKL